MPLPAVPLPAARRKAMPRAGGAVALPFAAGLIALAALPAAAQDAGQGADAFTLPPIIISAGLTPVPADEYGRAATVLDGQALRERGVQTVAEAVLQAPGVSVSPSDLSNTVVKLRGHGGAQTMVLIDGVEQVADLSGTLIGGLTMADVDRIEILRGPQAASYGMGASAGVVAIWTRRGVQEGLHYGLSIEGGGANGVAAMVSHRGPRGGLSFAADWRDDEGWDVSGDGGEKDGLRHRGLRLSGDFAATDDITLGFSLQHIREDYDFDTVSFAPTSEADYILDDSFPHGRSLRRQGQIWGEWRMLDGRLTHRLSYDMVRDDRTTAFSSSFDPTSVEVKRQALRYRLSYALDGQPVEASTQVISLMAERVKDDSPIEPRYRRATNSLALEYRGELAPGLSVQAAVRRDNNSNYANTNSWNAAVAYVLPGSGVKLHASAGDGRRKPVFYELYGDGVYTVANPDLLPERNRSIDAGVTVPFAGGAGSFDVTVFRERLTDRIDYDSSVFPSRYINDIGTSRRHGVELSANWQVTDSLTLRGQGTFINARDAAGDRELRIPRREIGLGATWDIHDGRGSLSANLRHVTGTLDRDLVTYQPVELRAYTVVDVAGRWAFDDRTALVARIDNLTDTDHADVWGYASRGRTAYVGLAANF